MTNNMNTNLTTDNTDVVLDKDMVNSAVEMSDDELDAVSGGAFNPTIHQYRGGLGGNMFQYWGADYCPRCHERKQANWVQLGTNMIRCARCYNQFRFN